MLHAVHGVTKCWTQLSNWTAKYYESTKLGNRLENDWLDLVGKVIKDAFTIEEALELRLKWWEGVHHGITFLVHQLWLPFSHNSRAVTETMFPTSLWYWWSGSLRNFADPFNLVGPGFIWNLIYWYQILCAGNYSSHAMLSNMTFCSHMWLLSCFIVISPIWDVL